MSLPWALRVADRTRLSHSLATLRWSNEKLSRNRQLHYWTLVQYSRASSNLSSRDVPARFCPIKGAVSHPQRLKPTCGPSPCAAVPYL